MFEPDFTGHRLNFVQHIADAVGGTNCVVITSSEALRTDEYLARAQSLGPRPVVLDDVPTRHTLLQRALDYAASRDARLLIVTEADRLLAATLLAAIRRPRRALRLRLLLLRTTTVAPGESPRPSLLIKPLLAQVVRRLPRVDLFFLTDALGVVDRRRGYANIEAVPDPVEVGHRRSRRSTALPWLPATQLAGRVGLFGVVSARKNLPLLVTAVAQTDGLVLVVAGRIDAAIVARLREDPTASQLAAEGRLVIENRLLDEAEFLAALAEVDVAAVLHDNDSPSGVLAQACFCGTPVVVPKGRWLGSVVDETGIGVSVELSAPDIAAAITRIVAEPQQFVTATKVASERLGTAKFVDMLLSHDPRPRTAETGVSG